jgi:hypothetical protein
MTKKNSKRLYDHYVKVGNKQGMTDMLLKYPDFNETNETNIQSGDDKREVESKGNKRKKK